MNYKGLLFFLGVNSVLVSFISILNIFYSVYFSFYSNLKSYIISFAASFLIGIALCFIGKNDRNNISIFTQILIILLSFIFIPILISIPYYLSGYNFGFFHSYFESVSGFTATGFTIINDIEFIDKPLLLWRSTSQWLGGLIFLISIIATLGIKKVKFKPLYLVEGAHEGGNFYNSFFSNFSKIFFIYFVTTIFVIFVFTLVNLRLFDAFNLAFTTISSGGFLHKESLSLILKNNFQTLFLSILLLLPVFNFYIFYKIFIRRMKINEHYEDFHLGVLAIILTSVLYFFFIPSENLSNVLLIVSSCLSNSGINMYSSDYDLSLLLIAVTMIGGSAVSTSSGIKYVRFYILTKISYLEIYKLVKPLNVLNRNLFNSNKIINNEDLKISFFIFISFIFGIFVLSSILSFDNINFENSFKLSILTLTNTVSSNMFGIKDLNFYDLNTVSKSTLMVFMIVGKIELIAILFLIKNFFLRE